MDSRIRLTGLVVASAMLLIGCERPLTSAVYTQESNVEGIRKALASEASSDGNSSKEEVVANPTGWATLKGSFKLLGSAPAMAPLSITKEQDICMPGGKSVLSETLVVGPNNEIKDVLIYLSTKSPGTPEWEHPSYSESATATRDFDQKACVFLSHVFAMRSTQTLRILNSDPVGHNTNIPAKGSMVPTNPTVPANSEAAYLPKGESNEPTNVTCSIHPWMSAYLIARDNPYFAVSKPDGTFEIANIPAGVDLEFRVWQEHFGFVREMQVSGQEVKDKKGTVKLKADNDATIDWQIEIPVN